MNNTYYMVKMDNFGYTCVDTFNSYEDAYSFGLAKGFMFTVVMINN